MISPNLPKKDVWTLAYQLNEYTPSEVEQMTGLTTDSQRDWRRRGFLPKNEKHARFDVFGVAGLYITKMFVDQGKSPGLAYSYAPRLAVSLVKSALMWRNSVWGRTDPLKIFDGVPDWSRRRTGWEHYHHNKGEPLPSDFNVGDDEKREWVIDTLLIAMGVRERVSPHGQAIWWPNGEVGVERYNDEGWSHPDGGLLDRVDPKFDGAASVIDLLGAGSNLARRSRLPFLSALLGVNENPEDGPRLGRQDLGMVKIMRGRIRGAESDEVYGE